MSKKFWKALYIVPVALVEALTVSFVANVKRRWNGPEKDKYMKIKVPKDYVDQKLEPEYKDLTQQTSPQNKQDGAYDFSGLPGFK